MFKTLLAALAFAGLSACATTATLNDAQTKAYFDACSAFNGAVNTASDALNTGKMSIKAATTVNATILAIAPLCSGTMPSDVASITPKIIASTTVILNGS